MDKIEQIKKPNFFVVGAAKAGTTSLWRYLMQHPEIFLPESDLYKEPAFFCKSARIGIKEEQKYFQLFAEAQEFHKAIGECSTVYLPCPDSACAIFEYANRFNINVKIIIMLRNPADRAYSLYNWNVLSGLEPEGSFLKALKLEKIRKYKKLPSFWLPSPTNLQYLYFETGLYAKQVQRYFDLFPRENIYIGIFEEFIKKPLDILQEIFNFLGVSPFSNINFQIYNPSYSVINPRLQVLLRKITRLLIKYKIIKNFKTIAERDFLLKLGLKKKKPSPLSNERRSWLLEKYKDDILQLETIINKNLRSIWLT